MHPRTTVGYPPLYALSLLFFVIALGGVVVLIGTDLIHHLSFTALHRHLTAWPLITIGLSCVTLNLVANYDRTDQLRGIFLGIAFLLWGAEQLLPTSRIVTFMDCGAVTIFVVDVGFTLWGRLSRGSVDSWLHI